MFGWKPNSISLESEHGGHRAESGRAESGRAAPVPAATPAAVAAAPAPAQTLTRAAWRLQVQQWGREQAAGRQGGSQGLEPSAAPALVHRYPHDMDLSIAPHNQLHASYSVFRYLNRRFNKNTNTKALCSSFRDKKYCIPLSGKVAPYFIKDEPFTQTYS